MGCIKPDYCGDGVVDTSRGEECDLGLLAQDTITGRDACTNVFAGDACVEGDVPCPLDCMQCLLWECTDGRWILSRLCLSMCP